MPTEQQSKSLPQDESPVPVRSWSGEFLRLWEAARSGDEDALHLLEQCTYFAGALLDARLPETAPTLGGANVIPDVLAMEHPELFFGGLDWFAEKDMKVIVERARRLAASVAGKKSGLARNTKLSASDAWRAIAKVEAARLHARRPNLRPSALATHILPKLPAPLPSHRTVREYVSRLLADWKRDKPQK